jgi:hypothetical protein
MRFTRSTLGHRLARVQRDAVLLVPGPGVEDDLVHRLLAREHGRQQDAVVVGMRLGAEHRDVVQVGLVFSSSSSVRTPAMPLPTSTSFCFFTRMSMAVCSACGAQAAVFSTCAWRV